MREIKFRAWDKEKKIMKVPSVNMLIDSFNGGAYWQFGYEMPDPMDVILMQYTGLKDKNGKEIYEGDILKDMDGNNDEVVWDSGSFLVKHSKTNYDFIASKNHFEIIGNIYENPDLLKP